MHNDKSLISSQIDGVMQDGRKSHFQVIEKTDFEVFRNFGNIFLDPK